MASQTNSSLDGHFPKSDTPPNEGRFLGFHHVEFFCSNAKQASDWYCMRFGFRRVAQRGLVAGDGNCRTHASHVIRQGQGRGRRNPIYFVFTCSLNPEDPATSTHFDWLAKRGDSVKDLAFRCTDVQGIYAKAVSRGAKGVMEPTRSGSEQTGWVWIAKLESYGGVVHSLIDDSEYFGVFLPGFNEVTQKDPIDSLLPPVGLEFIDHVVGNQPANGMLPAGDWYAKHLDFHRFWSVDDKQMHTEYSALRSMVMADWHESIKMPLNEPAPAKRRSQIQEYVDYHGGAGVQHMALNTPDILSAVAALRKRGVQFLNVPDTYYDLLRKRLTVASSAVPWDVDEVLRQLDIIQKLNILVDFDEQGYLLQLFSNPVEDRPTLFIEIIQRMGNQGFGVGNFKSLFEAIERQQDARGNLDATPQAQTGQQEV